MERSSVLDRVKLFLPQIEKANRELEQKIKTEGASSVQIDSHLNSKDEISPVVEDISANIDQLASNPLVSVKDTEDSTDKIDDADDFDVLAGNDPSNERASETAIIQVEFALGDFDETAIAVLEEDDDKSNDNDN